MVSTGDTEISLHITISQILGLPGEGGGTLESKLKILKVPRYA